MKKIVVIIPALNPNEDFVRYTEQLTNNEDVELIVIDDGSKQELKYIFEKISKNRKVTVITHEVNQGKGKALKDGMLYFLDNYSKKKASGVVTADSDGQHNIDDIISIGKKINRQNSSTLLLETRDFNLECVPPKSKKGNKITSRLFKILYGKKILDTQTGLRGLTRDFIEECVNLPGDRYEFELQMLIEAVKKEINIIQCDIKTIYINNNEETHFRPIVDSARIYKVMFRQFFRFILSGLSSCIIDLILFSILFNVLNGRIRESFVICVPTVCARIISSLYNYLINRGVVFNDYKGKSTIVKYYILCTVQMMSSYLLVDIIFNNIKIVYPTIIKFVVDTILFFISFQIQKKWVFKGKTGGK